MKELDFFSWVQAWEQDTFKRQQELESKVKKKQGIITSVDDEFFDDFPDMSLRLLQDFIARQLAQKDIGTTWSIYAEGNMQRDKTPKMKKQLETENSTSFVNSGIINIFKTLALVPPEEQEKQSEIVSVSEKQKRLNKVLSAFQNLKLDSAQKVEAILTIFGIFIDKRQIKKAKSLLYSPYKIAIIANMSAGKTTLINSWFGEEILPSLSEATSDCPVYIFSDDDGDNNGARIVFENGKAIALSQEQVRQELQHYAKKDSLKSEERYKGVKQIYLDWDFEIFQNTADSHLNFIFIDTPGPNNTDEFGTRHKQITEDIIQNEANMVFFVLDYGQLDANLEGKLWNLLKERKEKDKDFEAFFIINKVDLALRDNSSLSEIDNSSVENFYKSLKDFWFYHEEKAKQKVVEVAKKNGFDNPKVFCTSSEYNKMAKILKNSHALSFDDEDKLEAIIKKFKNIFQENWEEEFANYIQDISLNHAVLEHLGEIEQKILNDFLTLLAKSILEKYE
ncbi:hypothetical protein CQA53_07215 [Helicobacter didelphidarum]|uniref:Dynamin N-terminal domain-containing protein n=1 Tax=Helicobacter didelphidarum TaxID=2040648 RepID=A0A3D8IHX7_9HELI|nr:dynamin family protein [Helicobacter didelphidarum]RDU64937.1 hypothetical protein CQA53_07215 [Helicobacter didelphidarum]